MNWLLRLIGLGCRHRALYRERRRLHGVNVLHLICDDCGYAKPAIDRTAREHRHAVKVGTPRVSRAIGQGKVIAIQGAGTMRTAVSWSIETIVRTFELRALTDSLVVSVAAEVPSDGNGKRLPRFGNRYYPTFVDLSINGDETLIFHADEARELAGKLLAAADAADRIDVPDTDRCGHWAPCKCGKAATA
jgi:hypothetical protein